MSQNREYTREQLDNWQFRTTFPDSSMKPDGVDAHVGVLQDDEYYKARLLMENGDIRFWYWRRSGDSWVRAPCGPQFPPAIDAMLRAYTEASD